MLPQTAMIERLRQVCRQDSRLVAAMLYGSFTRGEGDQYSDIDTALFFADESLPGVDQMAWVGQIAPVIMYYHTEYGNGLAIFENLVRAEFHFDRASDMPNIESWRGNAWFHDLSSAILLDRTGALARHAQVLAGPPPGHANAQDVLFLCHSLFNWSLFGANVYLRGEHARALEVLNVVHDALQRMARLVEARPERWIAPAKALEQEISPESYRRFQSCTAALDPAALAQAYAAAWEWGSTLIAVLAARYDVTLPVAAREKITQRIHQLSTAASGR